MKTLLAKKWYCRIPNGLFGDYNPYTTPVYGNYQFDEYPSESEWLANFDFTKYPNMSALEPVHFSHLPVWSEGNVFMKGGRYPLS